MDIIFRHELIADEFLDFFNLWPDSHMSNRDISSLHALIADEYSSFLLLCLDNHMSHMGISSFVN